MSDTPIAWLRDLDGTGSLHVCADGDPGAIPVYAAADSAAERRGYARGLREAAEVAREHGEFCHNEAHHGGSHDLYERARGAAYIAERITAKAEEGVHMKATSLAAATPPHGDTGKDG